MNPDKIFYSCDGFETKGPVSLDAIKQMHQNGALRDFDTYSVPNSEGAYVQWLPVARSIKTAAQIRQRAHTRNLADIFQHYCGWLVGINLTAPTSFEVARLVGVAHDHVTFQLNEASSLRHFPLTQVLSVTEGAHNLITTVVQPIDRTLKQSAMTRFLMGDIKTLNATHISAQLEVPLLVEVHHLIVYKGSTSVGMSVPISGD